MPVYKEKQDKNILTVSSSNNLVKIKIDGDYGSTAKIGFIFNGTKRLINGEVKVIGSASELKGKILKFRGESSNKEGGKIKITHRIYEEGGNGLTYIFPTSYTGTPSINPMDEEPTYDFYVKFI